MNARSVLPSPLKSASWNTVASTDSGVTTGAENVPSPAPKAMPRSLLNPVLPARSRTPSPSKSPVPKARTATVERRGTCRRRGRGEVSAHDEVVLSILIEVPGHERGPGAVCVDQDGRAERAVPVAAQQDGFAVVVPADAASATPSPSKSAPTTAKTPIGGEDLFDGAQACGAVAEQDVDRLPGCRR